MHCLSCGTRGGVLHLFGSTAQAVLGSSAGMGGRRSETPKKETKSRTQATHRHRRCPPGKSSFRYTLAESSMPSHPLSAVATLKDA